LLCGHTPHYYQDLFERFGFSPARGDNIAFEIHVGEMSRKREQLQRIANKLRKKGTIRVRGANLDQWDEEVDNVHRLLNLALAHLPDHIGWHRESVDETFRAFKQFADPELVLFAEVGEEVVGWFAAVPNINEWLIHANGLRYPWDYLRLWWYSRSKPKSLAIKSVLVHPDFWDTGVGVILFDEMEKRATAKGYTWADLSLTSVDNPRTPILADHFGADIYKRYRVYRIYV
jgi:GNAT superfamily N-acetyltransferase